MLLHEWVEELRQHLSLLRSQSQRDTEVEWHGVERRKDHNPYQLGKDIQELLHNARMIMVTIGDVKALATNIRDRLVNLQTVVDTEQDQVAAALKKLQDIIDAGGGVTPADLQEVADILTSADANLSAVTTDVAGTIPDVP